MLLFRSISESLVQHRISISLIEHLVVDQVKETVEWTNVLFSSWNLQKNRDAAIFESMIIEAKLNK